MAFEAVIFDCDGVLVDSEAAVARVALVALEEIGLPYAEDTFTHRFTGMTVEKYFAELNDDHHKAFGTPLPDGFAERQLQDTKVEMDNTLEALPGVHAAVDSVTRKPIAVASSSGLDSLRTKLKIAGLYDAFAPHYYSGDQVEHGKPAPDLFLFAAEKLGVPAPTCIAIEDSVNGVRSAISAGMMVIGFTGGSHCRAGHDQYLVQAGATVVINHMNQLSDAVDVFQ